MINLPISLKVLKLICKRGMRMFGLGNCWSRTFAEYFNKSLLCNAGAKWEVETAEKKCIQLAAISIRSTGGNGTGIRAIKYKTLVKKPLAFFPLSAVSTEMNLKLRTSLFGKKEF